ncbi:MAG: hypothetical protein HRT71_21935 [Flavobacteriales bacterium]|nr:hypothetical protein [Flavobacteriales bacterium]
MLATNCDAQNSGNNSSVGGGFTSPQSKIFTSSKSSGKKKSSSNNKIGSFKLKQRPLVGGRDYSNSKPSYRSSNKKNKSLNGSFLRPQKTPSFSSKGSPFGNSHRMPSNKDHSKGQLQSSFQQAPFVPKSDALPLNTFFLDPKDKQSKSTVIPQNETRLSSKKSPDGLKSSFSQKAYKSSHPTQPLNTFSFNKNQKDKGNPKSVSSTFKSGLGGSFVPNTGSNSAFGTGSHIASDRKMKNGSSFGFGSAQFITPTSLMNGGMSLINFLSKKNDGSGAFAKNSAFGGKSRNNSGFKLKSSFNQMPFVPARDRLPLNYFHLDPKDKQEKGGFQPELQGRRAQRKVNKSNNSFAGSKGSGSDGLHDGLSSSSKRRNSKKNRSTSGGSNATAIPVTASAGFGTDNPSLFDRKMKGKRKNSSGSGFLNGSQNSNKKGYAINNLDPSKNKGNLGESSAMGSGSFGGPKGGLRGSFSQMPFFPTGDRLPLNYFFLDAKAGKLNTVSPTIHGKIPSHNLPRSGLFAQKQYGNNLVLQSSFGTYSGSFRDGADKNIFARRGKVAYSAVGKNIFARKQNGTNGGLSSSFGTYSGSVGSQVGKNLFARRGDVAYSAVGKNIFARRGNVANSAVGKNNFARNPNSTNGSLSSSFGTYSTPIGSQVGKNLFARRPNSTKGGLSSSFGSIAANPTSAVGKNLFARQIGGPKSGGTNSSFGKRMNNPRSGLASSFGTIMANPRSAVGKILFARRVGGPKLEGGNSFEKSMNNPRSGLTSSFGSLMIIPKSEVEKNIFARQTKSQTGEKGSPFLSARNIKQRGLLSSSFGSMPVMPNLEGNKNIFSRQMKAQVGEGSSPFNRQANASAENKLKAQNSKKGYKGPKDGLKSTFGSISLIPRSDVSKDFFAREPRLQRGEKGSPFNRNRGLSVENRLRAQNGKRGYKGPKDGLSSSFGSMPFFANSDVSKNIFSRNTSQSIGPSGSPFSRDRGLSVENRLRAQNLKGSYKGPKDGLSSSFGSIPLMPFADLRKNVFSRQLKPNNPMAGLKQNKRNMKGLVDHASSPFNLSSGLSMENRLRTQNEKRGYKGPRDGLSVSFGTLSALPSLERSKDIFESSWNSTASEKQNFLNSKRSYKGPNDGMSNSFVGPLRVPVLALSLSPFNSEISMSIEDRLRTQNSKRSYKGPKDGQNSAFKADVSKKKYEELPSAFMAPVEHKIIQGKKRKRTLFKKRSNRKQSQVGGGRPKDMGLFPSKLY